MIRTLKERALTAVSREAKFTVSRDSLRDPKTCLLFFALGPFEALPQSATRRIELNFLKNCKRV